MEDTSQELIVGSPAPSFELVTVLADGNESTASLSGYRGRWLALIFYPRDFSFICPTELISFSSEKDRFDEHGCELLGVSIDSPETHRDWLMTSPEDGGVQGLRFPLASDEQGNVCRDYGLWRRAAELPNRGLFLIDPEGVLKYAVSYDLAVGRNVDDVVRVLDALQSGGLCPANWKRADGVLDIAAMLKPGRVLGHYRITDELGRGAFGQVMAADDMRLKRPVALKIISTQSEAAEEALLAEARSAAGINHPNVCTIHAVDVIDLLPTIVMEYVDGDRLSDVIVQGMSDAEYRSVAAQVASGLAAAHASEVVHGDLKPANILIRKPHHPVIVDFGLARTMGKHARELPAASPTESDAGVTSTLDLTASLPHGSLSIDETVDAPINGAGSARVSGTPAYMAPEQFRGAPSTKSSDVFTLGLIFSEMLLGELPTLEMSLLEIYQAMQDESFIRTLVERIPSEHRGLIDRMLRTDAAERPSAEDVAGFFLAASSDVRP